MPTLTLRQRFIFYFLEIPRRPCYVHSRAMARHVVFPTPGVRIMSGIAAARRAARWSILGSVLALVLAVPAWARSDAAQPLARYIPAEGLAAFVEHAGFDAHPKDWKGTALYRMLNETSLGEMLADILGQVADQGFRAAQGAPLSGKELVGLISHLLNRGFAVGYLQNPQPPQPKGVVVVIRGAARNAVFQRVIRRIPPLN